MKGTLPLLAALLCWCILVPTNLKAQAETLTNKVVDSTTVLKKAQNKYRHEIQVVSENDNYLLQLRDGYYTNGLLVKFSYAGKKQTPVFSKRVQTIEAGQQIFNPNRFDSTNPITQDRPFAGYLYAKFQQRLFVKRHQALLGWSAGVGVIGKPSMAEHVQRWYHYLVGIYDVEGWQNQIADEWSVQVSGHYTRSLLNHSPEKRRWDLAATGQANLGNLFTDVSGGILLRAGWMESYQHSVHWDARVSRDGRPGPAHKRECYFFLHPVITWQAYNAVLEGGLFTHNQSPKTVAIEPWVLATQLGFKWAENRWTLGVHYTNRSRQAKTQIRQEHFLSVQVAYRSGKQ